MSQSVFQKERNQSNIDSRKLTEAIFGIPQVLKLFEEISQKLHDAIEVDFGYHEMNRLQLMEFRIRETIKHKNKILTKNFAEFKNFPYEVVVNNFLHEIGFIGTLMTAPLVNLVASEEQKRAWQPSLDKGVWLSCYAQTELGHGSDVANLGTVATFDQKTQEFVIHTPTIADIKWWPGDLGVFCTHAAVMAQLVVNGKNYGVQSFFMRIRDQNTYQPLPGLEIGDIGPKLGYFDKDNGFLK